MSDDNMKTEEEQKQQNKAEKHKARQQKIKEKVDERVNAADIEKGVLLVITGNGKGKTTSGFGTIARAVGHGKKAAVAQYIKGNWDCGERSLLEQHGVEFSTMATGFTWETQNKESDTAAAQETWAKSKTYLADENIDIVLLDEMTYMLTYGYIDIEELIRALNNRPAMQHVVITGRACHRRIIEMADTVSEVQSVKHAFEAGVKAQVGFDY